MFSITQSYETTLSPQQIEAWLNAKKAERGDYFGGNNAYNLSYSNNSFSMRKNRKNSRSPYYPVVNGDYKVASNGKTQVNIQIAPFSVVTPWAILPLVVGLVVISFLSFLFNNNQTSLSDVVSSTLMPLLYLAFTILTPLLIYSAISPVKEEQPWIEKELQLTKLSA